MKITKKKVTTVTETITYEIHPNARVIDVIVNGGPKTRQLIKHGKIEKKGEWRVDFFPIYNPDLKYLEISNPFWYWNRDKDDEWFKGSPLPEDPKDIDKSKIIFISSYDNSFWTIDKEPIPVVIYGDYIDDRIRSGRYDLEKLHQYLSNHEQVKEISGIERIPYYYNNESGREKCFTVKVLPTIQQLKEMVKLNKTRKYNNVKIWDEEKDFLGMKQFRIKESDDY